MLNRKYVTRAGDKLEHALNSFEVDVTGLVCADLGCHAGGFTDCLLKHEAARVYSVDTSYHILDWSLRNDERVVMMERTNAMHVELPEPVDFISIDVGWTPQRLILPHALTLLKPAGCIISLLKPHYEATDRERIRGKVRDELVEEIVQCTVDSLTVEGIITRGWIESPITGGKGKNKEFLLLIKAADCSYSPPPPTSDNME